MKPAKGAPTYAADEMADPDKTSPLTRRRRLSHATPPFYYMTTCGLLEFDLVTASSNFRFSCFR
ncbi:hypothetical protein CCACVL1_22049 [Corchorus capsularis]|uniref:Uncharacterized protein n=1 Tax=Corchorus capsularis TaxID=210143 RepID=A0A1R3H1J8_COCAP|nr:hypothetical protein CCACVL1_22049 [Corchorus capsularis]